MIHSEMNLGCFETLSNRFLTKERPKIPWVDTLICILFLLETAQKNEEKGDADFKKNEFSNAAILYTKAIEVKCKDVALNAVLYKKRAASHFFLGEFRKLF